MVESPVGSVIAEVISRFVSVFPTFEVVPETMAGVAWVRGKCRPIKSGCVYFYWPFWTELELVSIVRQTLNLQSYCLTTNDGISVLIGVVVVFEVTDPVSLLTKLHDHEDAIGDIVAGSLVKMVSGHTYDELRTEETNLKKDVAKQLKSYGIKTHNVFVNEIGKSRIFRLVGE